MSIRVREIETGVVNVPLRMPFDYGSVTLTECPLLFVSTTVDVDGNRQHGIASETIAPRWFLKDTTYEEALAAMLSVIDAACSNARSIEASTVFDCWYQLYERQRTWAENAEFPPLLWAFGVTLIERTLIDAWCRNRNLTFADAVRQGSLGIELDRIHADLAGMTPVDLLPFEPRRSIAVRHTIGHTDPLTEAELSPNQRLDDGLPQSLAAYLRTDGISHVKIKLTGEVDEDVERVTAIADVVQDHSSTYAYTADANEGYDHMNEVRTMWERVVERRPTFADRVLAIEQPLPRASSFSAATSKVLDDWASPPIIIDESDGDLDSLETALACGYAGTSHKNCKGVFKGIANACLIEWRNAQSDETYVMTAEDLLNLGPVALLQDLAVVATLGIENVERNGHHYVRGLSQLSDETARSVAAAHPDLYREHERGFFTLDIVDGTLSVDSIVDAPFGVAHDIDLSGFASIESIGDTGGC